jgi:hypothetical protein
MHKSATKCNETIGKWCKNKHGASKIIDTFETYQEADCLNFPGHLVMALIFMASCMRVSLVLHAVGCFDTLFGTANRLKLLRNMKRRALLLQI